MSTHSQDDLELLKMVEKSPRVVSKLPRQIHKHIFQDGQLALPNSSHSPVQHEKRLSGQPDERGWDEPPVLKHSSHHEHASVDIVSQARKKASEYDIVFEENQKWCNEAISENYSNEIWKAKAEYEKAAKEHKEQKMYKNNEAKKKQIELKNEISNLRQELDKKLSYLDTLDKDTKYFNSVKASQEAHIQTLLEKLDRLVANHKKSITRKNNISANDEISMHHIVPSASFRERLNQGQRHMIAAAKGAGRTVVNAMTPKASSINWLSSINALPRKQQGLFISHAYY